MKRSIRRASLGDMYGERSKFFTSPAIWLDRRAGSKRVMRVIPEVPASALSQASWTLLPRGQTMPRPVTTTLRRFNSELRLGVGLDVIDGLLDGGDLLRFLVRDLGLEFFFQRHHELDGVERIGAEVVDERRLVLDLRLIHAQLLGNDFLDCLLDVLRHRCSFPKGGVFYDIYMPPLTCRTVPVT